MDYRPSGYITEKLGSEDVAKRKPTQQDKLLKEYAKAYLGLTDEEAAINAGLEHTCYWKRCGELREKGYITTMELPMDGPTRDVARKGRAGVYRIVCWITDAGEDYLRGLSG